jgi:hypothetical protein
VQVQFVELFRYSVVERSMRFHTALLICTDMFTHFCRLIQDTEIVIGYISQICVKPKHMLHNPQIGNTVQSR